jgi:hydroxyacylglutathione hydrolase
MLVDTFPVGPLACNCSIVADTDTRRAIVIDPGGDFESIRARLVRNELKVEAILHTHAHIDHVGASAPLQDLTQAPARLHPADRFMFQLMGVQASMIGLALPAVPELHDDLIDGAVISVGSFELCVLHTPGHSPGSVALLLRCGSEQVLFSGDTLFEGGIGRTDLWGGDQAEIVRSIRNRLYTLDDSLRVITGHGGETTIGEEKRSNPFVRARG